MSSHCENQDEAFPCEVAELITNLALFPVKHSLVTLDVTSLDVDFLYLTRWLTGKKNAEER